jgi:hypothetical protein
MFSRGRGDVLTGRRICFACGNLFRGNGNSCASDNRSEFENNICLEQLPCQSTAQLCWALAWCIRGAVGVGIPIWRRTRRRWPCLGSLPQRIRLSGSEAVPGGSRTIEICALCAAGSMALRPRLRRTLPRLSLLNLRPGRWERRRSANFRALRRAIVSGGKQRRAMGERTRRCAPSTHQACGTARRIPGPPLDRV